MNIQKCHQKRPVLNIHLPNENCALGYCRMDWRSVKYTPPCNDYGNDTIKKIDTHSDNEVMRLQPKRAFSPDLVVALYSHASRRRTANPMTTYSANKTRFERRLPHKQVVNCVSHPLSENKSGLIGLKRPQQPRIQVCTGGFRRLSSVRVLTPGEAEFGVLVSNPNKLDWWKFPKITL